MSIYTDWQMAKNAVEAGDDFGYPAAIQYYNNLKQRMYHQLAIQNSLSRDAEAVIGKRLEQELTKMTTSLNNFELSDKTLTTIQNWVAEAFNGEQGGELSSLAGEITKLRESIDEQKSTKTREIEDLQLQIKELFNSEERLAKLAENALGGYASTMATDYNSVISFLTSFLLNMVQWTAEQGVEKVFINRNAKTTLLGYYKEIIEKKVLQQIFSTTSLKFPDVQLIAGANTINDLLIPFDSLNRTFSIEEMIGLLNQETEDVLISMGAQIKARNIKNVKTDFMKISHQANLRDMFNAQFTNSNSGFNPASWCCGVVFLGQMQNIIQTLGNNNVIFISGPNRMFMDNFIESFRAQKMYLAFQMVDGKATSQVGLQRFVDNRRNQLLSRFN